MNPQWSDEVKERYTKDQAFYAECTARGIQICQDTATVKLAIRNKSWVGLTEDDKVLIKHDANFNQFMTAGEYADRVQQLTEARLKDKNT